MDTAKITKQIIDFQKAAFDNSLSGMNAMQDLTENMMDGDLGQMPWVTDENKKPINDSFKIIKTARDDYKKAIHQGFEKLEKMTTTK
jgi:hypothetical protein